MIEKLYCMKCEKDVAVTKKMWNTYICDECGTIVQSDIGIENLTKPVRK